MNLESMNLLLPFILSLVCLVFASKFLIKFTDGLSSSIKLSPLVVAATAVAIGTSTPELFVSFSAILQGVSTLSTGDVIGSNIANGALIIGMGILLFPIRIGTEKTQRNNIILILLTAFFISSFFFPAGINRYTSIGLLAFYLIFLFLEIFWGEEGSRHEDKKALKKMKRSKLTPAANLLGMGLSIAVMGLSSKYVVCSAVGIANYLNVANEIVGLSIVAVGTSLPELTTSIMAGLKKEWKLLFGDFQGSNIFNLAVIGTVLNLFGQKQHFVGQNITLFFLCLTAIIIFLLTRHYSGKTIPRVFGLILILIYLFYLFILTRPQFF
jgi:cation:H+ antiporter